MPKTFLRYVQFVINGVRSSKPLLWVAQVKVPSELGGLGLVPAARMVERADSAVL